MVIFLSASAWLPVCHTAVMAMHDVVAEHCCLDDPDHLAVHHWTVEGGSADRHWRAARLGQYPGVLGSEPSPVRGAGSHGRRAAGGLDGAAQHSAGLGSSRSAFCWTWTWKPYLLLVSNIGHLETSRRKMKILVLVKHVPDATGDRRFADDGTLDRASTDGLLSELDEYAVEQALRIADERDDVEVVALTVGPDDAADAIKRALQMGASGGIQVNDEAMHGSDALATSAVLAAAIAKAAPDLVICGMAS